MPTPEPYGDTKLVEHVADDLYTVYCTAVGGVAFNGDPLPTWAEFVAHPDKQKQAAAWRAVASHVLEKL